MNQNISSGDWMLLLFLGSSGIGVISHFIASILSGSTKSKDELYQSTSKRLELVEKQNQEQQTQIDTQRIELFNMQKQHERDEKELNLDKAIIENRNPELETSLQELITLGSQTLGAVVELQKYLLTKEIKQDQLAEETQVN